jgi:alpha-L-fucosidase
MSGIDSAGVFAGDFFTPEQEIPATGIDSDWESCMTMNGSWGYKPSDHNWKSSEMLIRHLIDIVSKGGNFLLNVGPDSQGLFPPESVERLKAIGVWTKANGESIYGAKASPVDRPEWGRYTSKPGVVYAHVFDWPADGVLTVSKDIKVKSASLLTDPDTKLQFKTDESGVSVFLPTMAPDTVATVVKLIVEPENN